jgi:hypothetical protein
MGVDAAADHAAAMEEHEARQMLAASICGSIKTVGNIARWARQHAVRSHHARRIGAYEPLHELCERLAAVIERRARTIARRGRRHHGEKTLCQGIEWHIGSGAERPSAIVVYQS